MKRLAFYLLLIPFINNAQESDCSTMKTGTFTYLEIPGKISVRTEKEQLSYNNGNLEYIWNVTWISECEYEIILKKILIKDSPFKKGDRIVTNIINVEGKCYSFTFSYYQKGEDTPVKEGEGKLCKE